MIEHFSIDPVIEIASDRNTARGTWFSPGLGSFGPAQFQNWVWGKYDCDYIRQNGSWKLWHLRWYLTFFCAYEKGWVHQQEPELDSASESTRPKPRMIGHGAPDKPSTRHRPYKPNEVNYLLPEPPEPYESWENEHVKFAG